MPALLRTRVRPFTAAAARSRPLAGAAAVGLALLAAATAAASPTSRPLRVERSDAQGLRLTLDPGDTVWSARALRPGGPVLHELRLRGFTNAHAPGQRVVPSWGGWIVVPPGQRPEVQAIRETWEAAPARPLMVAPTPVLRRDPLSGEEALTEELLLPGETPREGGRLAPGAAADGLDDRAAGPEAGPAGAVGARAEAPVGVAVGEPRPWRGRRIAPVTVRPLAVDGDGRASRLLRAGSWEIRFVPDEGARGAAAGRAEETGAAAAPAATGRVSARGDQRFGSLFMNPEALRAWPTEPFAAPSAGAAGAVGAAAPAARRAALLGPELRLPVAQTRLYRVTAAALLARGYLPAGTLESQVRLYQRRYNADDPAHYLEIETPILMFGEGDEFAGDDFFVFYGLRPRDDGSYVADLGAGAVTVPGCGDPNENNNSGNIYWLAFAAPAAGGWARASSAALAPASGTPVASYRRVEYYEEDRAFQEFPNSGAADRCHLNTWRDYADNETIDLFSPDTTATDGEIRAGLYGNSNTDNPRLINVVANNGASDLTVGMPDVRTVAETVITTGATVAGTFLAASPTLTVRVTPYPIETGKNLYAFLDWVEVGYQAFYRARNNGLLFHGGQATGDRDLEVGGFTTDNLALLEITNPRQPVLIQLAAENRPADGAGWKLSLRVPQPDGVARRFLALADIAGSGVDEYAYVRARLVSAPGDPTAAAGSPDLIVIAHPRFQTADLARWADYRRSAAGGGFNVHVVSVEDVFDWFSGGLKDPWAIRRFCDYAVAHWGSWAVQLVGDANENVRGLRVTNGVLDLTPSQYYAQRAGQSPELLAVDKWFVTPGVDANYPTSCTTPAQMLLGRWPCNSEAELTAMVDKAIALDTSAPGQDWRRRGVFIADDAWSYGYFGSVNYNTTTYNDIEEGFQTSEDSLAARWDRVAGGAQVATRFFLSTYLDPHLPPGATTRSTEEYKGYTATEAVPPLLALLTQGALIVQFQGHANAKVFTHEDLIEDDRATGLTRWDVLSMNNVGRPWVFFGLGCHISEWAHDQSDRTLGQPSLGEKMLIHTGAAAAVYASPGFEYVYSNMDLAEVMGDVWFDAPPRPFDGGGAGRTRWVLGELMLGTEARILADPVWRHVATYREMAGEYCLLGDALLQLDAGPPLVAAVLEDAGGAPVADGMTLAALDAGNHRQLRLEADDEGGIDRVEVLGSDGADLSGAVTELAPPDPDTNQRALYAIDLPVRAFDHSVTLHVYDTADRLPTDEHATLTLRLPQVGVFRLAGSPTPIDPSELRFHQDSPLDFEGEVTTSAWVGEGAALSLAGVNLELSGVQIQRVDAQHLALGFTAVAPDSAAVKRAVSLTIDGYATEYLLQSAAPPETEAYVLGQVYAYPNPLRRATRILAQTDAPRAAGRIVIFTIGGRRVASLPITPDDFASVEGAPGGYPWVVAVDWDGRDAEGDAVANGIYLYRVELDSPNGGARSGMQRLAVMR